MIYMHIFPACDTSGRRCCGSLHQSASINASGFCRYQDILQKVSSLSLTWTTLFSAQCLPPPGGRSHCQRPGNKSESRKAEYQSEYATCKYTFPSIMTSDLLQGTGTENTGWPLNSTSCKASSISWLMTASSYSSSV